MEGQCRVEETGCIYTIYGIEAGVSTRGRAKCNRYQHALLMSSDTCKGTLLGNVTSRSLVSGS